MNEDDADQGTGLDTKYRIDSAQGEPHSYLDPRLLYSPCSDMTRVISISITVLGHRRPRT